MLALIYLVVSLSLLDIAYLQKCHYNEYTHKERMKQVIERFYENMKSQSEAQLQDLFKISSKFQETSTEKASEIVKSATSTIESSINEGVASYFDQFEFKATEAASMLFGAGEVVENVLERKLSQSKKPCDDATNQVSTDTLSESYDHLDHCVRIAEVPVQGTIDSAISAMRNVIGEYGALLERSKSDIDKYSLEIATFARDSSKRIKEACESLRRRLDVVNRSFKVCLDGIVRKTTSIISRLVESLSSLVGDLVGGLLQ